MLDHDQNDLPSVIDNHHSIIENAIHLLSRSNSISSFLSSWIIDRRFEKPSKKIERGGAEPTCLELPSLVNLGLKSFQIQSLNLSFEGFGQFGLIANRPRLKENIITNETRTPKKVILKAYDFSPDCTALQQHIDFSKLQTLELINCANIGFLFNNMLCTYKTYHLTKLRIREDNLECQHTGYFGKEKLERFLMLHTGLEELTFTNLGANRPSLKAISAQVATLQSLTIHDSTSPYRSNATQRSTFSVDDLRHLSKGCPYS